MNKKELKEKIMSDLGRWTSDLTVKGMLVHLLKRPEFKYMYFLRKCNYYHTNKSKLFYIYRFILKHYQYKYGVEIPYDTKIGKGLYIGHIGAITVNRNAIIGENVHILKGALIGYIPRGSKKGCPTIGDRVWIGPNSNIVGNINIGNDVLIAPGALVNFDVPSNSVVVGNPAKIIPNEKAAEGYVNVN